MVIKMASGALALMFAATAAVAGPLRPAMVLPGQSVPAQTAAGSGAGQLQVAQGAQDAPEPARPRVRRRNSFFGVPLVLLAAGTGVGVGVAASGSTASPQ